MGSYHKYLDFGLLSLFPVLPVLTPGIQSPSQMELLAKHNPSRPVFVEGPFPLWLRKTCVYYYILRADPTPLDEKVGKPCFNPFVVLLCKISVK